MEEAKVAAILTPIRVQILEACKKWREIKELCEIVKCGRTTMLYHLDVLIKARYIEEAVMPLFRTRKKIYKAIVEVDGNGVRSREEDAPKAPGTS
jgi:DNA-binding transcriptional ArsR family regulator